MNLASATVRTPFTTDTHGVVRIGASRVTLERIVRSFDAGASAEEIVMRYPTLDLADVYATIAFILNNRPEIDAYMTESEAESDRLERERKTQYPTHELKRRIRERVAH